MPAAWSEPQFLKLLAERPEDRSLRLVFSDWLMDQGDPRGEAIALWESGRRGSGDRRRQKRLVARHGREWLGEKLWAAVRPELCVWEGGFPVALSLKREPSPAFWMRLVGEARLATVRSLELDPFSQWILPAFFLQPALRGLTSLLAPPRVLGSLAGSKLPFSLETLGLLSLGTFEGELSALSRVEALFPVHGLELRTLEMVTALSVRDLRRSMRDQRPALQRFRTVLLDVVLGSIEGVAAWLTPGRDRGFLEQDWSGGEAWAARYKGVTFRLARDAQGSFRALTVDTRGPEGAEELGPKLTVAATVLVLLNDARLESVDVQLPEGAGTRRGERDALRAALRRLKSVGRFTLGGRPVVP